MDTEETFFIALKNHRESKGIEIDEISDYTKINPKYLKAIEEGDFSVIPNIYMRLFIRSYANYIDADYKQALVDYELHTTGKIQPKFFETEEDNLLRTKKIADNTKTLLNDDFQINYRQVATIIITIVAIYLGFKLVEFISSDNLDGNSQEVIPSTSENTIKETDVIEAKNNIFGTSLLTNKDFKNSQLIYQITEIIPSDLKESIITIKTLKNTKINILTHHENGAVFF